MAVVAPVAISIGLQLVLALLTPSPEPEVRQPPRPKVGEGEPIELLFGRHRVSAFPLWMTEVEIERANGGKGSSNDDEDEYRVNIAFAFCEPGLGPISLRRLWLGSDYELVYDANNPDAGLNIDFSWHPGTETQMPDPLIESIEGVGNVSAHRGIAYIVIQNLPLKTFGNRVPTIAEAELESGGSPVNISDIILRVSEEPGIDVPRELIDVSEITDTVSGFLWNRNVDGRSILEDLSIVANGSIINYEQDGIIHFIKQQRPGVTARIDLDQMGARPWGEAPIDFYQHRSVREHDIKKQVEVVYANTKDDYQKASRSSLPRPKSEARGVRKIETGAALTPEQALAIAEKVYLQQFLAADKLENVFLPPAYAGLKPGDVVEFKLGGVWRRYQIKQIKEGADGRIGIGDGGTDSAAIRYDASAFAPHIPANVINSPSNTSGDAHANNPPIAGEALVVLHDTPALHSSHGNLVLYASVKPQSGTWENWSIYARRSGEATWRLAARTRPGTYGRCRNSDMLNAFTLPNPWDGSPPIDSTTRLRIQLDRGQLANLASDAAFEQQEQILLVGSELVVARNAQLVGENEWEVWNLERFARGSDYAAGTHVADEDVYLMRGTSAAIAQIQGDESFLGKGIDLKAVPAGSGRSPDDIVLESSYQVVGRSLFPFSPVNIGGKTDPAGQLTISCQPRARGMGLTAGEEPPSRYQWRIIDGADVVLISRETSKPELVLSSAEVASLPADYKVEVRKISAIVGPGFPGIADPLQLGTPLSAPNRNGQSYLALNESEPREAGDLPLIPESEIENAIVVAWDTNGNAYQLGAGQPSSSMTNSELVSGSRPLMESDFKKYLYTFSTEDVIISVNANTLNNPDNFEFALIKYDSGEAIAQFEQPVKVNRQTGSTIRVAEKYGIIWFRYSAFTGEWLGIGSTTEIEVSSFLAGDENNLVAGNNSAIAIGDGLRLTNGILSSSPSLQPVRILTDKTLAPEDNGKTFLVKASIAVTLPDKETMGGTPIQCIFWLEDSLTITYQTTGNTVLQAEGNIQNKRYTPVCVSYIPSNFLGDTIDVYTLFGVLS